MKPMLITNYTEAGLVQVDDNNNSKIIITCKGVARGSWGAHDPTFVSLFLSKQPTIFRGENAMTILFDPV